MFALTGVFKNEFSTVRAFDMGIGGGGREFLLKRRHEANGDKCKRAKKEAENKPAKSRPLFARSYSGTKNCAYKPNPYKHGFLLGRQSGVPWRLYIFRGCSLHLAKSRCFERLKFVCRPKAES